MRGYQDAKWHDNVVIKRTTKIQISPHSFRHETWTLAYVHVPREAKRWKWAASKDFNLARPSIFFLCVHVPFPRQGCPFYTSTTSMPKSPWDWFELQLA